MKNVDMQIKLLAILCALGLMALVFVYVFSLLAPYSPQKASEEYRAILQKNNLEKDAGLIGGDSKEASLKNIEKSVQAIKDALSKKYVPISADESSLQKDFSDINQKVANKQYKDSLELIQKTIDSTNKKVEDYKQKHKDDFWGMNVAAYEYIRDSGGMLVNYHVAGFWALATIVPASIKTDSANIVFRKETNSWKIFMGPATYLSKEKAKDAGAPKEIIDTINRVRPEDLLTVFLY